MTRKDLITRLLKAGFTETSHNLFERLDGKYGVMPARIIENEATGRALLRAVGVKM